jgi:opacity protein-like surface antigen
MNTARFLLSAILLVLVVNLPALAQSNELGVMGGFVVPEGGATNGSTGGAVEGFVAHRIFKVPMVGIYAELPIVGGIGSGAVGFDGDAASYSSLFITPGVKFRLSPPVFPLAPYVMAGAGYAHFSGSQSGIGNSTSKFAFDYGIGAEMKIFPHVSINGEVREFETGSFDILSVSGITGHNLAVLFGIGLRL